MKPTENQENIAGVTVADVGTSALLGGLVNVEAAIRLYGEPEYGYFKEWVQATGRGRNVNHYGTGKIETTKEEYDANRLASRRTDSARFMGEYRGSFYRYTVQLKKAGWPQHLAKQLKAMEDAALSSA